MTFFEAYKKYPASNTQRRVKKAAWLVLVLSLLGVAIISRNVSHLQTEYNVDQFFAKDDTSYEFAKTIKKKYRLEENPAAVMVLTFADGSLWTKAERARELQDLTQHLASIDGVRKVLSYANRPGAHVHRNQIQIGNLIDILAPSKWEQRFRTDALMTPLFLSKDLRTTLIYLELKSAEVSNMNALFAQVKMMVDERLPGLQVQLGGVPALQSDFKLLLESEMTRFVALAMLITLLLTLSLFRDIGSTIINMVTVIAGNLFVLSTMVLAGWPLTVLSVTVPILVTVSIVSQIVHMLFRLDEEGFHQTNWQKILKCHRQLLMPNFLSALTTAIGFITLTLSDIVLIANYGKVMAATIMYAWAFTSFFTIPLSLILPLPKPRSWTKMKSRWHHSLLAWRRSVVILTVLISGIAVTGLSALNWGSRLFDDLPEHLESRKTTEMIDQKLGGLIPLELEITASNAEAWSDPTRLKKFAQLSAELRTWPGIGQVIGYSDFIQTFDNKAMNQRKSVAEIILLYSMSDNNPLDHFLSQDTHSARLALKLNDIPGDQMMALTQNIKARAIEFFPEDKVREAGMGYHMHPSNNRVSQGLIFGFWQAMLAIGITLVLAFRSLRWALVACLPNLVPPAILIGFLALTQTPIKPPLALVFSISLGLAFNNTVYLLARIQEFIRAGRFSHLIERVLAQEGVSCLHSTLVIFCGFSVFLLAGFSVNKLLGAFMLISIAAGLAADILFLPCLLKWMPGILGIHRSKEVTR